MKSPLSGHALNLFVWLVLMQSANAQKAPELGYVYPPVLPPGKTTDVQLGGYDFTNEMQFFVHDKKVKLNVEGKPGRFLVPEPPYWFGEKGRSTAFPIPREVPAKLIVDKDHPPGMVRWQVANANGSSATAVFYVSDIQEVVENRYRHEAQILKALPIGVSGRLSRISEIDRYSFQAKQNGPITIELFARTLGANFNGLIEVRNSSGRVIADAADTEGLDTALTFAAKAGQRYTVHLHDVDFRGNRAFVYRLAVTPGPRVVATIPTMGKRGETRDVQFIGYGVATGKNTLESIKRKITFPKDENSAVLRYRLETDFGVAAPFEIPLSDNSETSRPNDDGNPMKLTVPAAVNGTLTNRPHEFIWTAKKSESFQLAAVSRAVGGRLDLSLEIKDVNGKTLAANDDFAGSVDSSIVFKAPADGNYICRVIDLSGRAGKTDSIYRLSIERPKPGYSLHGTQQLNIKVGTKINMKVIVERTGGFTAPIPIRIEGLSKGITTPPPDKLVVPEGKSELIIALESAEKSAAIAAPIRIVGQVDGQPAVVAHAPAAGNLCPRNIEANQIDRVLVSTTLTPAFSVELVDKNRQRAVHRGTTYPAPFIIKRNDGFDGAIELQMAARQGRHRQGIDAPVLPVPAGATEVLYPCYMPEWLETDRTTRMVVLGVGHQKDPLGNIREVTKQADARITMILEGALLQVSHKVKELTVDAGQSFEIPVVVSRSAKLPVPVKLQIVVPAELKELLKMEPKQVVLAPTDSNRRLRFVTTNNAALNGRWPLTIKATALQDGRWLVVSQTEFSVQFNSASSSPTND